MVNIAPSIADRAVMVGMTGSGKTTLAYQLLRVRPYVVVFDAKGLIHWPGFFRYTEFNQLTQSKFPRLIYAPNHKEITDTAIHEKFFSWIYHRENTTVYVDEVYAITNKNELPHYYHAILTRGRELNISTFSSTQRPKMIPQVILSESEHYYIFRLLLPQDRQKMREILPISEVQQMRLKKHCFMYGNAEGTIVGPLKLAL